MKTGALQLRRRAATGTATLPVPMTRTDRSTRRPTETRMLALDFAGADVGGTARGVLRRRPRGRDPKRLGALRDDGWCVRRRSRTLCHSDGPHGWTRNASADPKSRRTRRAQWRGPSRRPSPRRWAPSSLTVDFIKIGPAALDDACLPWLMAEEKRQWRQPRRWRLRRSGRHRPRLGREPGRR